MKSEARNPKSECLPAGGIGCHGPACAVGQASLLSLTSSNKSWVKSLRPVWSAHHAVKNGIKDGDRRDACPTLPAASSYFGFRASFGFRISDFGFAPLALALACLLSPAVRAGDYNLDTTYQNRWFAPSPAGGPFTNYFGTNASTALYGGSVLGNSTNTLPKGGSYGLAQCSFGQPVEGIRSDVSLGSPIVPPPGTDTNQPPANFVAVSYGNNATVYYQSPDGGAFWVPSTHQIIAAQPNNIVIEWLTLTGTTNRQVLNVSAVPAKRPARLFWTESPYDAPVVSLQGLFPVIHYNSEVPSPVYDVTTTTNGGVVTTTTNVLSGVWLDAQKQLHAKAVSGMFLIEYYKEGSYRQQVQPDGLEIVQVLEPLVQLVDADVGSRLMPVDTYWANVDGINGILPNVTHGLNDTAYVYAQTGPKNNWAFAIKRTWDAPWSLEIYWQHQGRMGVTWPYEVDWYYCDWPQHPQLFVFGDSPADTTPALFPTELSTALMEDMDPPLHATLSASGRSLSTTQPGTCLLKHTTSDNIWFEVVQTVSHTNELYFDLEPKPWTIGQEILPGDPEAHALQFDGTNDYVIAAESFLNQLSDWSLSFWFSPSLITNGTLYSEGDPLLTLQVGLMADGQLSVGVWNQTVPGNWVRTTTTNAPVLANHWQQLTVTLTGGSDTNGTLRLYLDDYVWEATNFVRLNLVSGRAYQAVMAAASSHAASISDFFQGKLDEVRLWNMALTADQIRSNRFDVWPDTAGSLVANFSFNEGQGAVAHNSAGDIDGTVVSASWCWGQVIPTGDSVAFPGFVHVPEGDRFNVNFYNYPTEAVPGAVSHVYAVNTGQLEVWWANQSQQPDMPAVYYPSRVVRYLSEWPANAPQIVIASGLGSSGDQLQPQTLQFDGQLDATASLYYQNDPTLPGYNPNEEHALILGGVAYALRNDLNTSNSSAPFVLVDYLDANSGEPAMEVFSVVATNAEYRFERDLNAGLPILPLMPLGAMPLCTKNSSDTMPPAWPDRKLGWWAVSAGDDGGEADAIMHFYYQMQPTFYFPAVAASAQPAIGQEVPWLPTPSSTAGTSGVPVVVTYHISWPDNLPELQLGQTLTTATRGLPDVWNQLSVDVKYDQSSRLANGPSVVLFDPVADQEVDLDRAVIDALLPSDYARQDLTSPLIHFPKLPPSLYPRLFFDPDRGTNGRLVLEGQLVSTLTGSGYLLLNLLENFEKAMANDTASGITTDLSNKWAIAVQALPGTLELISPNTPYVQAALGARLTNGVGYVTLAFNNSTNAQQVPPSLPVSLSLLKVVPELYSGDLEVLQPDDVLAEQLSLRYSADFSGQVGQTIYQWRWVEPSGGLIPNTNFGIWAVYGSDPTPGTNEVTISGASPFTLSDHYFAVRYRPTVTTGPTGTNWSDWTYNLAPGWVKRAMTGINPFEQAYHDMVANAVDTRVTMVSQAGGPYEGDVALNLDAASSAGLIATYQTIFNRAKEFSLLAGLSDPGVNQTLLFAASRLNDLYALLGNEAYADAQDPTIAFPRSLAEDQHGADATSIFPFMNQVPNLLEEELAFLRGRDDTLEPSVHTSPIYNRLIWNFTAGINGGEAAYAYNYNLRGTPTNTVGMITAEDAKRLYPQGHGDAWGHYLSAISGYYDLLSYTNFAWHTEAEATLIGNAAVSTDYLDEQKFAETAAARARTGAEIVKQTFRQCYSEDPTGRWPGYHDSNTNRAWGIGEWASRAGQAAYYDWAVANSLMLDSLTNMTQVGGADQPPEGIQKIDRASTPELGEIAKTFQDIQTQVDSADTGLNPLGLARNVVPFDIDPTAIDQGKTHFEQIYDRALQALYNACVAFDHARGATLQLREQSDSAANLEESLALNEIDYHNRLLELYGYPYPDDIGPGKTYPQGYEGPDLINWQILDLENLLADAPTGQVMQVQVINLDFSTSQDWTKTKYEDYKNITGTGTTNSVGTVTVYMADNGLKVKPPGWTGHRTAQGELQLALSDFVQSWYSLDAKKAEYNKTLAELETDLDHRQADYTRYTSEWNQDESVVTSKKAIAGIIAGLRDVGRLFDMAADAELESATAAAGMIPSEIAGLVGPFPVENLAMNPGKAAVVTIATTTAWVRRFVTAGIDAASEGLEAGQLSREADLEKLLKADEYQALMRWGTADTLVKLREQYVKQAELFAQVEALAQSQERINKLLAEGERLIFERGQVRSRAAQRIQMERYADLSFRIFRNDALSRYQTAFDLAARYTYLAAKAYDYETGLLSSDTTQTPGSKFLADVVRARLPGRFYVWLGTPMVGGTSGEPGLADILARMKGDWDVVKGRYGFNNPDTETSRFSLRSELYRISPSSSSDATWAQALENCKVANLHEVPEFIRYCRPFIDTTNVEPALVIPFSTFVVARKNYFGQDLAGGDNAYDASHAATKIRSAGVWFTGYNTTFNTNSTGGGLGNEPRVYLIPVGDDVMRSSTRNAIETRSWTVFDQAIPLPYNVGGADVDNPDWIPVMNSLREPLAQIRRYDSMRAYHDNGQFDEAETHNNSRLVGRSVWNTRWLLIIPGSTLLADPAEGIERFVHGALVNGTRDGNGIKDIKIFFQTYSLSGD